MFLFHGNRRKIYIYHPCFCPLCQNIAESVLPDFDRNPWKITETESHQILQISKTNAAEFRLTCSEVSKICRKSFQFVICRKITSVFIILDYGWGKFVPSSRALRRVARAVQLDDARTAALLRGAAAVLERQRAGLRVDPHAHLSFFHSEFAGRLL